MSFNDLGLDQDILTAISELGFENPMPIQEKVIPHLLNDSSRDLIGLAQTGTGKTAAFGLPIVQNTDTRSKSIQYLILAPTRELCLQIADDLKDYSKYKKDVRIGAVFGGSSIDQQLKMLKRGVHVISATPGRLVDLINRGKVNLENVKTVVLDEADEMLNMGFRDELEAILTETPKDRQTLLFSATMPREVASISKRYMSNPEEMSSGKRNAGAENINHVSYTVNARDRYNALKRIADYNPEIYGIVFCKTRRETQEIADKLINDGYNADSLHGDLSQAQRDAVMNKFRIKHIKMLVATDVAARGLDVNDLTHVINYNLPDEREAYTHRSGRTGRAGKSGTSIIIANLKEKNKIFQIEKQIGKKFEAKTVPSGKAICEKQLFHLIDRMEKVEVDASEIEEFLPKIYKKLEWLDREELIKKFVSVEFNRFLDYYKKAKDLSGPTESKRGERGERNRTSEEGFTRFFINLGRRDDLTPVKVIGMVKDYTEIKDIDIGAIEILQNFSFFEVESAYDADVLNGFNDKLNKGRKIAVEVAEGKGSSGGRSDRSDGQRRKTGRGASRRIDERGSRDSRGGGGGGFNRRGSKPKRR